MDPASKIIRRFGGAYSVAAITGTAYTAPYRWQAPREKGGTGGLIPQRHHLTLLAYARAHGIRLTADDFLAAEDEVSLPTAGPGTARPYPAPVVAQDATRNAPAQAAPMPELPPEAEPTCSADSERATTPPSSPAPFFRS